MTGVVVSVTDIRLVTDTLGVVDDVRENNALGDTDEEIDTDLETTVLEEWLSDFTSLVLIKAVRDTLEITVELIVTPAERESVN